MWSQNYPSSTLTHATDWESPAATHYPRRVNGVTKHRERPTSEPERERERERERAIPCMGPCTNDVIGKGGGVGPKKTTNGREAE